MIRKKASKYQNPKRSNKYRLIINQQAILQRQALKVKQDRTKRFSTDLCASSKVH